MRILPNQIVKIFWFVQRGDFEHILSFKNRTTKGIFVFIQEKPPIIRNLWESITNIVLVLFFNQFYVIFRKQRFRHLMIFTFDLSAACLLYNSAFKSIISLLRLVLFLPENIAPYSNWVLATLTWRKYASELIIKSFRIVSFEILYPLAFSLAYLPQNCTAWFVFFTYRLLNLFIFIALLISKNNLSLRIRSKCFKLSLYNFGTFIEFFSQIFWKFYALVSFAARLDNFINEIFESEMRLCFERVKVAWKHACFY